MKKSEKQDLLNEIERLHKRIEREEKLNFSRTAEITRLETELDTRDKVCKELCAQLDEKGKQIEELETELRVKEDLFAIKGAISERKINLNDTIQVKLTPIGADIYYHQYDNLNKDYGRIVIEPHLPKTDENGYAKFQLHQFISLYGEHIGMALPNVIEPLDIILCK